MPADWRPLYPFESHFLDVAGSPGVRQHYVDEGAGQPILMVHGNPTWSFYWRRLIGACRDRFRCVAVDHVGCGLSDKPQQYPYSLRTHADNLLALIEKLDLQNIVLVAHDWGGAIGTLAAVDAPSRFAKIVLLNTGAFPPPFVPWRIAACRLPILGTAAVRGLNAFAKAAITMAVEKPLPAEVAAGLLAPYDSWANRVAIDRFVADIPFNKSHPTYGVLADLEQRLPTLAHLPILLAWGMRDWCFRPECLRRLQQIWPHAQSLELADCGHYVMEDGHDRLIPVIRNFAASAEAAPVVGATESSDVSESARP
jgi:pimeloyl-ACP methyl ester carboxylesterase